MTTKPPKNPLVYCRFCGNHKVRASNVEKPCAACCKVINEQNLRRALKLYREADDFYGRCCGSLREDGKNSHFYFHSEAFDDSYPKKAEDDELQVCVEAGINFYSNHAQAYYLRDFGNSSDSQEFGEPVFYGRYDFWKAVKKELDGAAEAAWNADLLTCAGCGCHYTEGNCECGHGQPKEVKFEVTGVLERTDGLEPIEAADGATVGYKLADGRTVKLALALEVHSKDGKKIDYVTSDKDMDKLGFTLVQYDHADFAEDED